MEVRVATSSDVQTVAVTLTDAFASDPVWGWAFPGPAQLEVWWRFWVASAVPQQWVRMTGNGDAVAVWIPPDGHEVAPHDEAHVPSLVQALAGSRSPAVLEALDRFEANHPRDEPHYYLSLLATAPTARGQGLGMTLLAENLSQVDEQHAPAYLESSNPKNLERYESVGFAPVGEFRIPDGNAVVTTMWRPPQ
jgi:GNAT superfamily N-acetyltransferase